MQRLLHAHTVQRVGEQGVVGLAREGAKPDLVRRNLAGKAQREVGAAVVAAGADDYAGALGVGAGDLDGVRHGLGAGGDQQALFGERAGGQRVQALAHFHVGLVRHHLKAGVGVQVQLRLYGGDHPSVQVAGVEHGDAAGKVDEAAALHIPELGVAGLLDEVVMGLAHAPGDGGVAAGEKGGVGEVAVLLHGGRRGGLRGNERMGRILEVAPHTVHVQRSAVWRALCRSKILDRQSLIWCAPSRCTIRLLFSPPDAHSQPGPADTAGQPDR